MRRLRRVTFELLVEQIGSLPASMMDAKTDDLLVETRNKMTQLKTALEQATDVADPSAAMRRVFGNEGAYAASLHVIFAQVHQSKGTLKLRAPRPARRRQGDERGFQALGFMLGTKLEPEQEAAAVEAVSKRQRGPHGLVHSHNELAIAAEAYLRDRIAKRG